VAKKQLNKNVVRTTPRGTIADTIVVYHPPKKRTKKAVHAIRTHCANLDCNNHKRYRSPNPLCRSCRQEQREVDRIAKYFRAIRQPAWTTGYLVPEVGGSYWNFYIAPFLRECVELVTVWNLRASYTPLYTPTPPTEEVGDA
jgi:hypothetical protein